MRKLALLLTAAVAFVVEPVYTLPFDAYRSQVWLRGRVNDRGPAWLLFDSAAGSSTISRRLTHQFGLEHLQFATATAGGAGPAQLQVPVLRGVTFSIDGFRHIPSQLPSIPHEGIDVLFGRRIDAILGKDLLLRYVLELDSVARQVRLPVQLIGLLKGHTRQPGCKFVFSSPKGNREYHMLDHCKDVATRAGLDPANFDLKTFRSTFASRTLRAGFDVRTVQHWMGHKSLETTMRYLVPSQEVHARLDQVTVPGLDDVEPSRRKVRTRECAEPGRKRPRPDAKPLAKEVHQHSDDNVAGRSARGKSSERHS